MILWPGIFSHQERKIGPPDKKENVLPEKEKIVSRALSFF